MGKSLLPTVLTRIDQALAKRLSLSSSLTTVFNSASSAAEGYWSWAGWSCDFFLLIEKPPVLLALLLVPAAPQSVSAARVLLPDGPYGYSWRSREDSRQSVHGRVPARQCHAAGNCAEWRGSGAAHRAA